MKLRCLDYESEIEIPQDVLENEILTCSCCSAEYYLENGELKIIELIKEDFGE